MKDCKAAYRNKLQNLFNKAKPGKGYKPSQATNQRHCMTFKNDLAFANYLNSFYCRFDL
jgi:hypothetical protein